MQISQPKSRALLHAIWQHFESNKPSGNQVFFDGAKQMQRVLPHLLQGLVVNHTKLCCILYGLAGVDPELYGPCYLLVVRICLHQSCSKHAAPHWGPPCYSSLHTAA